MPKTENKKILELELRIRFLEKQKSLLELQLETAHAKTEIFDKLVELAVATPRLAKSDRHLELSERPASQQPSRH